MNKQLILLLITIFFLSCKSTIDKVNNKINYLYGIENISINEENLNEIYLNNNRLKILTNLVTVNNLYSEKDSIIKENLKINIGLEDITVQQTKLYDDVIKLEKRLKSRLREYEQRKPNTQKHYFIFFKAPNIGKQRVVLLDKNYKVIFDEFFFSYY